MSPNGAGWRNFVSSIRRRRPISLNTDCSFYRFQKEEEQESCKHGIHTGQDCRVQPWKCAFMGEGISFEKAGSNLDILIKYNLSGLFH